MSCFLFFCYFTFLQKYVLFIIPYAMADDTSPQKESMTVAGRVYFLVSQICLFGHSNDIRNPVNWIAERRLCP